MGNNHHKAAGIPNVHDSRLTWVFEKYSSQDAKGQRLLSLLNFEALFTGQASIGRQLFHQFQRDHPDTDCTNGFDLETFHMCSETILDLVSTSQQLEFYARVLSGGKEDFSQDDVKQIFRLVFHFEYSLLGISPEEPSVAALQPFVSALLPGDKTCVSLGSLVRYFSQQMPAIFSSLHSFVSSAIRDFNNTSMSKPSPSACSANTLKLSRVLSPVLAWALSCTLGPSYLPESPAASDTGETPSLSSLAKILEGWSSLYCSDQHGLSPNRLVHHVFSYRGPSILLISMEGFSYCLAIDDEWIDGSKAFGSSHCLLIQTEPQYKAQPSEPGIILFNSHSRAATRGLIIGKGNPRIIHIDDLFDKAMHFSIPVKLHAVEVWGCGGHDALKQQAAQKEWESREVDRAKNRKLKIDDWTDSPDRQLLELGGVCTEHAER